jgi:hypothetical protein
MHPHKPYSGPQWYNKKIVQRHALTVARAAVSPAQPVTSVTPTNTTTQDTSRSSAPPTPPPPLSPLPLLQTTDPDPAPSPDPTPRPSPNPFESGSEGCRATMSAPLAPTPLGLTASMDTQLARPNEGSGERLGRRIFKHARLERRGAGDSQAWHTRTTNEVCYALHLLHGKGRPLASRDPRSHWLVHDEAQCHQ